MSEVKEIPETKQKGNPIENGINKIKEGAANELNKKITEQLKVVINANKILKTEIAKLREMEKEIEVEKIELNELLKDLK